MPFADSQCTSQFFTDSDLGSTQNSVHPSDIARTRPGSSLKSVRRYSHRLEPPRALARQCRARPRSSGPASREARSPGQGRPRLRSQACPVAQASSGAGESGRARLHRQVPNNRSARREAELRRGRGHPLPSGRRPRVHLFKIRSNGGERAAADPIAKAARRNRCGCRGQATNNGRAAAVIAPA